VACTVTLQTTATHFIADARYRIVGSSVLKLKQFKKGHFHRHQHHLEAKTNCLLEGWYYKSVVRNLVSVPS
jgi:hypothetical protein